MARNKSPKHPSIGLEAAVRRAREIYQLLGKSTENINVVFENLGFTNLRSSSVLRMQAALSTYGLISRDSRTKTLTLTRLALEILHGVPDSDELNTSLKEAFLSPPMFRYCWEHWEGEMVDRNIMKSHLVLERNFTPQAAERFMKVYIESVDFIGIDSETDLVEQDEALPEIVTDEEITSEVLSQAELIHSSSARSQQQLDRLDPSLSVDEINTKDSVRSRSIYQTEIFNIEGGEVSLKYPSSLSTVDLEDIKDWFEIWLKRTRRRTTTNAPK